MSPNKLFNTPFTIKEEDFNSWNDAKRFITDEEYQLIKAIHTTTPGCYNTPSPLESAILYRLASQSVGHIFEWGVWKGRSTTILRLAAGNNTVISQDHFLGDKTGGKDSSFIDTYNNLRHNTPHGLLVADISKLPSHIINWKLFTTLVYDAVHDYDSTMRALDIPLIEVPKGSFLYLHDFKRFDTARVVDKITEQGKWIIFHLLDTRDGAVVLRKEHY